MWLLKNPFLGCLLAASTIFFAAGCKKNHQVNSTSSQNSWFSRAPSSTLVLPLTNERIDVRSYRIDPSTEAEVASQMGRFSRSTMTLHL